MCARVRARARVADKLAAGSERGVEALEARNYATQHGARYHETSAMSGKGISELFEDVAAHFVAQRAGLTSATAKPNAAAANSANTAAASASAAKSRGNADKCKHCLCVCVEPTVAHINSETCKSEC
jgi:hypothetical protein